MKNFSFAARFGLCRVVTFLFLVTPLAAQQGINTDQIVANKTVEQDIRQKTAAVASEIQSMIDELQANGISDDDIKVMKATQAALANLSGPEMDQVIQSLQHASETPDTDARQQEAVRAFAGQQSIILQFSEILKEYEEREMANDLPERLKVLVAKETQALLLTAHMYQQNPRVRTPIFLVNVLKVTQQVALANQQGIGKETAQVIQQLDDALQKVKGDAAANLVQADKDLKGDVLQNSLHGAEEDIQASNLANALVDQKAARDELRRIAKEVNPPENATDALAQTKAALDTIIEDQKSLLDQTNTLSRANNTRTGSLGDQQTSLVDRADELSQDLQVLSPDVKSLVSSAVTPMQTSQSILGARWQNKNNLTKSEKSQEEAIEELEGAAKLLDQQLADTQKNTPDNPNDSTAKLKDLQKEIAQTEQDQKKLSDPTDAASSPTPEPSSPAATDQAMEQQDQLAQKTAALKTAAQPISLPTSQALAAAASKMNDARQAMSDPSKSGDVKADQKAAEDDLDQAGKQVAQELAQNQDQKANRSELSDAKNALQKAQDSVSEALADTGKSPASSSSSPPATPDQKPSPAPTNRDGSPSQASSGSPSSKRPGQPPGSSPSPPPGSNPSGSPDNSPSPSNPPQPSPSMAEAAKALDQAAQETKAAAETPHLPSSASEAVKSAQASIAQGQQAAAKSDAAGTAQAASDAQKALAKAQADVAMAQAGMDPDQQASSQPGNTPGQSPSTSPGSQPSSQPGTTQPGESSNGATSLNGGSTQTGKLTDATSKGKFVTVALRDRAAIDQTQSEKVPQEYAPAIDQYLKNLADQSSAAK